MICKIKVVGRNSIFECRLFLMRKCVKGLGQMKSRCKIEIVKGVKSGQKWNVRIGEWSSTVE